MNHPNVYVCPAVAEAGIIFVKALCGWLGIHLLLHNTEGQLAHQCRQYCRNSNVAKNSLMIIFYTAQKYLSGATSVSITINESDYFYFPSITFCHHFKNRSNIVWKLREIIDEKGKDDVDQDDVKEAIERLR